MTDVQQRPQSCALPPLASATVAAQPGPGAPAFRSRLRAALAATARAEVLVLVSFPLLKLLVHAMVGAGYGYHRDELYSLVCADHLAAGYVDHPPFSILVLAVVRAIVGDSVAAIRIVPAVAGALTVLLVGLMARRLGGGVVAQALAMAAALVSPFYLALDAYFSMNAFDLLAWAVAAWLVLRILQGGPERLWVWLGIVLGVALENKIGVLWFGGGVFVALLATPERSLLRSRGPWIGATIALLLFSPYVAWQATHHWATLHFIRNASAEKLIEASTLDFFGRQIAGMLPVAAPVWMAGLAFYLVLPQGRRLRALGWTWIAVFALLALNKTSRGVYLAPAYSWLLAAGGVTIESWRGRVGQWAGLGLGAVILAQGVRGVPYVLPILPEGTLAAHSAESDADQPVEEKHATTAVPEFFAHMSGWPAIVQTIARAADKIPAAERAKAVVLAPDYGMAAAIDVLGRPMGLPAAASGHNSYWLWGPPEPWPTVAIVVGQKETRLREWFDEVTLAGETSCDYCMPYENHRPIWIVRHPRVSFADVWPRLQFYE